SRSAASRNARPPLTLVAALGVARIAESDERARGERTNAYRALVQRCRSPLPQRERPERWHREYERPNTPYEPRRWERPHENHGGVHRKKDRRRWSGIPQSPKSD